MGRSRTMNEQNEKSRTRPLLPLHNVFFSGLFGSPSKSLFGGNSTSQTGKPNKSN